MHALIVSLRRLAFPLALASMALRAEAAAAPAKAAPGDKAPKPDLEVVSIQEIPKSSFSTDGRNPFFPDTNPDKGGKVRPSPTNAVEVAAFVLNGITSPPKRMAIINNRTFEPGEEGEVKLNGGSRILVKCLEIKDDGAVILVSGQRRELKLRIF